MNIRPHRKIKRRKTKKIQVGNVSVGGDSIISVQSMTNTLTTDVKGTINQILELKDVGADIVRVSCPDENSTKCYGPNRIIIGSFQHGFIELAHRGNFC